MNTSWLVRVFFLFRSRITLYNLILHLFRLFRGGPIRLRMKTTCKNIKIEGKTQIKLIYFHIIKAKLNIRSKLRNHRVVIIMLNVKTWRHHEKGEKREHKFELCMMKLWCCSATNHFSLIFGLSFWGIFEQVEESIELIWMDLINGNVENGFCCVVCTSHRISSRMA